mmetsp:Transcript_31407/g.73916  ORF Transcript_31407/g.73916 Transcript_31407/m.73916 type:complete len:216 (-) Transcript_31407:674-1321(-)
MASVQNSFFFALLGRLVVFATGWGGWVLLIVVGGGGGGGVIGTVVATPLRYRHCNCSCIIRGCCGCGCDCDCCRFVGRFRLPQRAPLAVQLDFSDEQELLGSWILEPNGSLDAIEGAPKGLSHRVLLLPLDLHSQRVDGEFPRPLRVPADGRPHMLFLEGFFLVVVVVVVVAIMEPLECAIGTVLEAHRRVSPQFDHGFDEGALVQYIGNGKRVR